ncbi:MAG TPA: hypothetical protein VK105_13790 [Virgibacillus sp.]|nr:hypothetical protein [Virgibacillus sp.]HLR68178.1 hypothetical protein [Virgibacillus sp.]
MNLKDNPNVKNRKNNVNNPIIWFDVPNLSALPVYLGLINGNKSTNIFDEKNTITQRI